MIFVKIVFLFAYLFGVIVVVPGCNLEVAAFVVDYLLHLGHFLMYALDGGTPYLHQQVFGGVDGLGHDVVGHVRAEVGEAQ